MWYWYKSFQRLNVARRNSVLNEGGSFKISGRQANLVTYAALLLTFTLIQTVSVYRLSEFYPGIEFGSVPGLWYNDLFLPMGLLWPPFLMAIFLLSILQGGSHRSTSGQDTVLNEEEDQDFRLMAVLYTVILFAVAGGLSTLVVSTLEQQSPAILLQGGLEREAFKQILPAELLPLAYVYIGAGLIFLSWAFDHIHPEESDLQQKTVVHLTKDKVEPGLSSPTISRIKWIYLSIISIVGILVQLVVGTPIPLVAYLLSPIFIIGAVTVTAGVVITLNIITASLELR